MKKTIDARVESLERQLGLAGDDGPLTFRILTTLYDADGVAYWTDAATGERVTLPDGVEPFSLEVGG
jgi:hypothetical protein